MIATDPERHRVGGIVHPYAADIGRVRKQVFGELTGLGGAADLVGRLQFNDVDTSIARVEMQEKEYTAVSEDVLRNLQALEMVIAMGKDGARQTIQDRYKPVEQPARTVPERIDEDPNVPGSTMFSG